MLHYLLTGLVAGFIASILAGKYGRNATSWFWFCLIFPPAILILLVEGENTEFFQQEELKRQQEKEYEERKRQEANEYTECPYCAELVKKKAKVCKHCGRDIVPKEIEL